MKKLFHLDLFAGIGGFSYAADQVWPRIEHIFVENDKFCQAVLRKHWPESEIYGDIRQFNPDTFNEGLASGEQEQQTTRQRGQRAIPRQGQRPFLLTGGFPCQPFSTAGLRRGTADERHLWPEMLRVIRLTKPSWVIAENVRGLLTWDEGLVFEQVCADLEAEGYEVQPLIIPAVAVNAPHRRDRVWFIAHTKSVGGRRRGNGEDDRPAGEIQERDKMGQLAEPSTLWDRPWAEVAAELCSVDDGLPAELDGLKLSKSQHRKEQLKAYGNAIAPQVAIEIMRAIKEAA